MTGKRHVNDAPEPGDRLDAALRRLAEVDIDAHTVAVAILRFRWTGEQVAQFEGISRRTVARRWCLARAFLRRELGGEGSP